MSIRIQSVCVDAIDPIALGRWWAEGLGWRITDESETEVVLEPPAGSREEGVVPDLLFLKVPEHKFVKNRWHLDLRPEDQADEIARFSKLGAPQIDVGQDDDATWAVMADPEGNEFCILRALTPDELAS